MFDEERPAPKPALALDLLSIEDLEARVVALRDEIAHCEALIGKKRAVREAANAMFGAGPRGGDGA